jgi:hypothetical protein
VRCAPGNPVIFGLQRCLSTKKVRDDVERATWALPGISTIRIIDPRFHTPRGLRPGDEPQKVLNAHGSPYRLNGKTFVPDIHAFPPPHTGDTWTYCEPRDPVCDHAVFVSFDPQGRVSSITLGRSLPVD